MLRCCYRCGLLVEERKDQNVHCWFLGVNHGGYPRCFSGFLTGDYHKVNLLLFGVNMFMVVLVLVIHIASVGASLIRC
jgi:hypothetical protein